MSYISLGVLLILLVAVTTVWASTSAPYTIRKQVLSSGGEPMESSSGEVTMNSTIGQPVTGESTSRNYAVIPGFWSRLSQWVQEIFLPLIVKD